MNPLHIPFRHDFVGSFLRPSRLKKAREDFSNKKITLDQLTKIENEEITELVAKQKDLGYNVLSDGEFRRSYWHLDFMWGFNGVEETTLEHGYHFHDEETAAGSIKLIQKITGEKHPFIQHFKFVNQFADAEHIVKQTFPAPAQLLAELFRGDNAKDTLAIYPNEEDLIQDIANAYQTFIKELYKAGCRNIQLDDCTWGMFCDTHYWESRQKNSVSIEDEADKYLRVNNLALTNLPADLAVATHVCRGNYHSTYACSGGYEPIANFLFAKENVQTFYLEFDDDRSGGFEPLRFVPDNKKVVLGLVTTKRATLENKENIIARIKEASKFIPLERLALSPQCGFASCEIGNKLTEQEQWDKLQLVKEIADEVWKK